MLHFNTQDAPGINLVSLFNDIDVDIDVYVVVGVYLDDGAFPSKAVDDEIRIIIFYVDLFDDDVFGVNISDDDIFVVNVLNDDVSDIFDVDDVVVFVEGVFGVINDVVNMFADEELLVNVVDVFVDDSSGMLTSILSISMISRLLIMCTS